MKKLLIAEDDTFLIKVYESKLIKVGFDIRIARDGLEVFEILENFSPDCILLDLMLPKMNGFQVLTRLKSNPKIAGIPVVIASNLGQPEDKQKALELGALDFFVKSDLGIQELVDKVQQYFSEFSENR